MLQASISDNILYDNAKYVNESKVVDMYQSNLFNVDFEKSLSKEQKIELKDDEQLAKRNHIDMLKKNIITSKITRYKRDLDRYLKKSDNREFIVNVLMNFEANNLKKYCPDIDHQILFLTIKSIRIKKYNAKDFLSNAYPDKEPSNIEEALIIIEKIIEYDTNASYTMNDVINLINQNIFEIDFIFELCRKYLMGCIYDIYNNINETQNVDIVIYNLIKINYIYINQLYQKNVYSFELNELCVYILNSSSNNEILELTLNILHNMNSYNKNILYIDLVPILNNFLITMSSNFSNITIQEISIKFITKLIILGKFTNCVKIIKLFIKTLYHHIDKYDYVIKVLELFNIIDDESIIKYSTEYNINSLFDITVSALTKNLGSFLVYYNSNIIISKLLKLNLVEKKDINQQLFEQIAVLHKNIIKLSEETINIYECKRCMNLTDALSVVDTYIKEDKFKDSIKDNWLELLAKGLKVSINLSYISPDIYDKMVDIVLQIIDKNDKVHSLKYSLEILFIIMIQHKTLSEEKEKIIFNFLDDNEKFRKIGILYYINLISIFISNEIVIEKILNILYKLINNNWSCIEFIIELQFADTLEKIIKIYYTKSNTIMDIVFNYMNMYNFDKSSQIPNKFQDYSKKCIENSTFKTCFKETISVFPDLYNKGNKFT